MSTRSNGTWLGIQATVNTPHRWQHCLCSIYALYSRVFLNYTLKWTNIYDCRTIMSKTSSHRKCELRKFCVYTWQNTLGCKTDRWMDGCPSMLLFMRVAPLKCLVAIKYALARLKSSVAVTRCLDASSCTLYIHIYMLISSDNWYKKGIWCVREQYMFI